MQNNKNLILAMVFSLAFLMLWQYFYEIPRQEKFKENTQLQNSFETQNLKKQAQNEVPKIANSVMQNSITPFLSNEVALKSAGRVKFENEAIKGSINPIGLELDDVELKNYKTAGKDTILFSPSSTREAYFASFGFVSNDAKIEIPNSETKWNIKTVNKNHFVAEWLNSKNILFRVTFILDDRYMFDIKQEVINNSGQNINIAPFSRIIRAEPQIKEKTIISHEGFVYNVANTFYEIKYKKLQDKKRVEYPNVNSMIWGGFTDKYWLSSFFYNNLVCVSQNCAPSSSTLSTNYILKNNINNFQIDFITQGQLLKKGENLAINLKLFTGAKELKVLNQYQKQGFDIDGKSYPFKHFDKTVDFGLFWFLTKPIFMLLTFLNSFLHNFGFSIILLTIIVKLILFPLATKSYLSMGKMKHIAPEVQNLRKTITDKIELNKKVMELYKKKNINPLSGCLPIIFQIPVFFALYKVLYISLEMRDAPFIFWITDLSAKDPTSLFNLFGLIPIAIPSFLQIGVLPILMGLTTFIQQSLSPKSGDATQNMIIKTMPFVLIFIFASFPSGIVLYWVVNNVLSILQQLFIEKFILPKHLKYRAKGKK